MGTRRKHFYAFFPFSCSQFDQKEQKSFLGSRKDYWDFLCSALQRQRGNTEPARFVHSQGKVPRLVSAQSGPVTRTLTGMASGLGDTGLPKAPFSPIPAPPTINPLARFSSPCSPVLSTPPATPFPPVAPSPMTPFVIYQRFPSSLSLGSPSSLCSNLPNFAPCTRQLKTPLGKGRAFIRFCLAHGQLAEYLQLCLLNPELTR